MVGGITLGTEFLNECVPLWFALLMGFTSPYMWSNYAKDGVQKVFKRYTSSGE